MNSYPNTEVKRIIKVQICVCLFKDLTDKEKGDNLYNQIINYNVQSSYLINTAIKLIHNKQLLNIKIYERGNNFEAYNDLIEDVNNMLYKIRIYIKNYGYKWLDLSDILSACYLI